MSKTIQDLNKKELKQLKKIHNKLMKNINERKRLDYELCKIYGEVD